MPLLLKTVITGIVGQNTVFGSFMHFSTLTEIPILQALMAKGMHTGTPAEHTRRQKSPRTKKTLVYIGLVVVYATISGLLFGSIVCLDEGRSRAAIRPAGHERTMLNQIIF